MAIVKTGTATITNVETGEVETSEVFAVETPADLAALFGMTMADLADLQELAESDWD